MKKNNILIISIFMILATTLGVISCADDSQVIKIASKNFTENIILAEMMKEVLVNDTDLEVEIQANLGSTFVVHQAMESGEVDMYPDYTGTLYQAKLKKTDRVNAEESLRIVKSEMLEKFEWVVFDSMGINNTYALGLKLADAERLGINKISDLRNHQDLLFGFDNEFVDRPDGGKNMLKYYGIEFKNKIINLEIGLKYQALNEGKVSLIDVFSTDSKLKRFDMQVLEDDKAFFPAYYAVSVVRKEVIDAHPEIAVALEKLVNILDQESMIDLNFQVEEEKKNPTDVVREFLTEKGVI